MELSILIPTVPERRKEQSDILMNLSQRKIKACEAINFFDGELRTFTSEDLTFEILLFESPINSTTLGVKRNRMLEAANGKYVCFIDDDDKADKDYIECILAAIHQKPDVIGFKGMYIENGKEIKPFRISKIYDKWNETDSYYERTPNHLSPVKRELALQAKFPDKTIGEDYGYSVRLKPLLQTEIFIDRILYHYQFNSNKTIAQKK